MMTWSNSHLRSRNKSRMQIRTTTLQMSRIKIKMSSKTKTQQISKIKIRTSSKTKMSSKRTRIKKRRRKMLTWKMEI